MCPQIQMWEKLEIGNNTGFGPSLLSARLGYIWLIFHQVDLRDGGVHFQGLGQGYNCFVTDLIVAQVDLRDRRVDLQGLGPGYTSDLSPSCS